jgi:hypothetical protein
VQSVNALGVAAAGAGSVAGLVTGASAAMYVATVSTSAFDSICFDIARIRSPSTSSGCWPRRPVWKRSTCDATYHAGMPARRGAPMSALPSPDGPWQETQDR